VTTAKRTLISDLLLRAVVPSLLSAGLLAVVAAACGGDDNGAAPAPTESTPGEDQRFSAVVVTEDLAVGPNRFGVGVIDEQEGRPLLNAQVSLHFFKVISDNQAQLRFEDETEFVGFETFYIDEETGKKVTTGDTGVYVAAAEFDEAGEWGVEIDGSADGENIGPLRLAFQVFPPEQVLNIGDRAPRSRQKIASDVADISEIDSMLPSDPFHDVAIADAVGSGRPTVVLFGTPAFCETRTCAPVMETVMLALYERYKDQASFIHVEPYLLEELRNGIGTCAVPAFNAEFARQGVGEGGGECPTTSEDEIQAAGESWNLTAEPIVFVIDREGKIAGKFEGIVAPQEVEEVLRRLAGLTAPATGDVLSLTVALHRAGVHGGDSWIGPIVAVLLLMALMAVAFRSRRP